MTALENQIATTDVVASLDIEMVKNFNGEINRLTEVLGLFDPSIVAAGTTMYTYKVTGELETDAVAEGDEIPLSHYKVEKTPVSTLGIKKYRKLTTAEAILKGGFANAVTKTDYYTDADGDWIHSAGRLLDGLEEFYERTGVQPYVYILPNGQTTSGSELTAMAERLYPELFSDEGHLLLVFCDAGDGTFNCGYTVGTAASAIMDSEALGILADELDYAYNNADTDEEVFSDAFSETAKRIMAAAEDEKRDQTFLVAAGVVAVVVAAGFGIAYVVKRRKAKEAEEQERMEEILNTPLEKFGDKDVEDLADKYEDDGPITGDKD